MALGLGTVAEFLTAARVLLQDTVTTYRYSDDELLIALNIGLLSARQKRPDLFLAVPDAVPSYDTNDATAIAIDAQYLPSLLYFVVGFTHLRDEEDTNDQRAAALLNKFTSQLLTVAS